MSKCPYCGAEVEYGIGAHYDRTTGLQPIFECECPACGEMWDEGRPEPRPARDEDAEDEERKFADGTLNS